MDRRQRLVAYIRVSAVMGRDDLQSPDLQLGAIRDLARRRDLREVAVVEDIDVSGRTFSREGVDTVMRMARAGQVDVVAVLNLSRFGRNTAESLRYIAELRALGVSVVSTTEQIDDTPEGQFMLATFLSMAQLYSDQISRGWVATALHNAERGYLHGSVPLGYRRVPPRVVEIDPVGAAVVMRLFTDCADGVNLAELARTASALTGGRVRPTTVKELLRNPAYLGEVRFKGQTFPGLHEPIVPVGLWNRAQERLTTPTGPSRTVQATHALAGIVKCAADGCGLQLKRKPGRTRRGDVSTAYVCQGQAVTGCPGIGAPRVEQVEAAVLAEVVALAQRLRVDETALAARRAHRASAVTDASRIEKDLKRTNRDLAVLAVKLAQNVLTDHTYAQAAAGLEEHRAQLVTELRRAQEAKAAPATVTVGHAERIVKGWPGWAPKQRNRLLRELIRTVDVHPPQRRGQPVADRLTVNWL